MKELSQRAEVSLATLYRYFPSKDYLLLAIALDRYETAYRRILSERPRGSTARERVANHLLREFGAEQKIQELGRLAFDRAGVAVERRHEERAQAAQGRELVRGEEASYGTRHQLPRRLGESGNVGFTAAGLRRRGFRDQCWSRRQGGECFEEPTAFHG